MVSKLIIGMMVLINFPIISWGQFSLPDINLERSIKTQLGISFGEEIQQIHIDTTKVLFCNEQGITSVEGLEKFKKLTVLSLEGNSINNIFPITKLPHLKYVNLSFNEIDDISDFAITYSNDFAIDLSYNCITDFSAPDNNWANKLEILGSSLQNNVCGNADLTSILYRFEAELVDTTTNEVNFIYRGWSSGDTLGIISFGDGMTAIGICNSLTQVVSHTYNDLTGKIARLELNGQILELSLDILKSKVTLEQPTNNSNINDQNPIFSWSNNSLSDFNYQLLIFNVCDSMVYGNTILDANSMTLFNDTLANNTGYQWKVRPLKDGTYGQWSEVYNFSIGDSLEISGLNSEYCLVDTSILVDATPSGGVLSGVGIIDISFNPSLANPGNHLMVYSYVDDYGCSSSVSWELEVIELPQVPIIIVNGNTSICEGEEIILSSDQSSNNVWNNGSISNSIIVNEEGDYFLNAVDQNGCSSDTSNIITISVNPSPVPSLITSTGDSSLCEGDNLILTVYGGTSFEWNSGAITQEIIVSESGLYTAYVANDFNCEDSISIEIESLQSELSVPILEYVNGTLVASESDTYFWFLNDSLIQESQQIWSPTISGYYTVQILDGNSCTIISDSVFVEIGDTMIVDGQFSIYPNPANENITIDLSGIEKGRIIVLVFDQIGRVFYSQDLNEEEEKVLILDLKEYGFRNGVYFTSVISREGRESLKFVVY